ncbi:MAG: hypothetical protein SOU07_05990 [Bacilli bacterium]|nr:hypothetical protein [Acholeplasmataceae bacterium]MDY2902972.1 hypothetical protein [Bacilli bacterium]
MIKIIIATPKGELINEDVDSIVVDGDNGQLGILTNRLPVITKISNGYIKINSSSVRFASIVNGVIDFQDNVAMVISQDAAISNSYEEAKEIIRKRNEEINKANKQKNVDFVEAEKELFKNIKESKAGHID